MQYGQERGFLGLVIIYMMCHVVLFGIFGHFLIGSNQNTSLSSVSD